ncbi:MAG: Holliday junction branch migration protein RuvA [Spirochaetia bacterium]|nr:Holliday junction branch migration protein RuvA [Spirochaetia bacterium]
MIYSLKGKVQNLSAFFVTLEVNGIGYGVNIPLGAFEEINKNKSKDIQLYTRFIVTETEQSLYGFLNEAEAHLFDFLRSLQGIGPKMALNLISGISSEILLSVLQSGEKEKLLRIPGIGGTKAEKILFEAGQKRNKLMRLENLLSKGPLSLETQIEVKTDKNPVKTQIEEALMALGFQKKEIEKAEYKIKNMNESNLPSLKDEFLQDWIRLYLSLL